MRITLLALSVALATPSAADGGVADIADGITSYRLTASFCHWPIPAKIERVLARDEAHFKAKDPETFAAGAKSAAARHELLARSEPGYCQSVKESREEMTQSLLRRAD